MGDSDRTPSDRSSSQPDTLPIPQRSDSIDTLERTMIALADVVRRGESIAFATNYAASANWVRDAEQKAVAGMPPDELFMWKHYKKGHCKLPKVEWDAIQEEASTSTRPLRIARRRAEALNRLYKTDKACPEHSVWIVKNQLVMLPLIKAMARVIGAERDMLGGQCALDATQLADLQSINKILSVCSQVVAGPGSNSSTPAIALAQQVLGLHRNTLRETLKGIERKRKILCKEGSERRIMPRRNVDN